MNILVVGDIIFDKYVYGDVNRICPEAPVPVLNVKDVEYRPGGAANVTANLIAMGNRVALVGVVGNTDGEETPALYQLFSHKDGFSGIVVDDGRATTIKTRYVSNNQTMIRIDEEDTFAVNSRIEGLLIQQIYQHIKAADVIVISDYGKGVITPNVCRAIHSRAAAKPVVIDPNPGNVRMYKYAHTMTPNLKQANEMGPGLRANAWTLFGMNSGTFVRNVVVTNGEDGAVLFRAGNDGIKVDTILPPAVKDISGAGDVFVATYASMLAHADKLYAQIPDTILKQIIRIACITASQSVYHFGTWVVDKDAAGFIDNSLDKFYEERAKSATRTMYGDCGL